MNPIILDETMILRDLTNARPRFSRKSLLLPDGSGIATGFVQRVV